MIKKDPNGLIRNDILHLRKIFSSKGYTPEDDIAKVMYEEGKKVVIDYIEREMVAKRTDDYGLNASK